jgi:two-component system, sensor histidine kinase and response regulator
MPNVLVIDDADDVRHAVVRTLQHFGFATREARNGAAGIEMALADAPDLIICDVRMPELDGYKTLKAIRDLPAIANIPFIFLTAAIEKDDLRRGMVSGADDYLTKPFTQAELLEAVTSRLARQTELECEFYKRAEKFHRGVDNLFVREITGPLDGIAGMTTELVRDANQMPPEKVAERARRINETVARLNRLAKTMA